MRGKRRLSVRLVLAGLYMAGACGLPLWLAWHSPAAWREASAESPTGAPIEDAAATLARWRAEYAAEQRAKAAIKHELPLALAMSERLNAHAASALALLDTR